MDRKIKQLIKQINDGNDLEVNLPVYIEILNDSYSDLALLKMTMNCVTFYDRIAGDAEQGTDSLAEASEFVNGSMELALCKDFNQEAYEGLVRSLDGEREKITDCMQVLTAYTDRFLIYEYVLNRMEARYYPQPRAAEEDSVFMQRVLKFIFGSKDNAVINENIKTVIGQLPVRMARSRYFELVKDSMSIYKGSDKSAVDTYLYMLRTSAMIYEPKGLNRYFTEFKVLAEELEQTDLQSLDKEKYDMLTEKIASAGRSIQQISEYCLSLQEVINPLYAYLLALPYRMSEEKPENLACREIIEETLALFKKGEFCAIDDQVYNKFRSVEGKQEILYQNIEQLEAVLEEVTAVHGQLAESMMLGKRLNGLNRMSRLLSSSLFAQLEELQAEEADEEYISRLTNQLMNDLADSFRRHPKAVNRAVIANTINKMPVFFHTADEVTEFIKNSLEQCRDEGEKQISRNLINSIIEEEEMYFRGNP